MLRDVLGKLVMEAKLLAFLERLMGESVRTTDSISMSSTQRARLIAWLNQNSVPASFDQLPSNRIRIADLLIGAGFSSEERPGAQIGITEPDRGNWPEERSAQTRRSGSVVGLGIDIQACSSMPQVDDFRSDAFYSANFSAVELAHCIQQGDPLLSLAGLWAAKEAIIKSGAAAREKNVGLARIEVLHNSDGSPQYRNCLISISHDHGIAVGVCIRLDS